MPVSTLQVLQYSPDDGTWEPTPGYEGTVVSDFWRDVFPPEAVCWWAVGWLGGDVVYYSWQAENACTGEVLMPGVVGELPGPPGVMGPPGPPGIEGPPGPALQFVGVWDVNSTYQPGQVVTYDNGTNNETWVANVTNTASAPVAGNPNWSLLPSTPGATGPQGPPGVQGPPGTAGSDGAPGTDGDDGQGFMWLGAWTTGSAYVPYDVVTYQGSSYVCIVANNGSVPPPSAQWQLQAQVGAPGTPGTPGATGAQGPPGPGVPTGGTQNQLLLKNSSINYDTSWQNLSPLLPPPVTTGSAVATYTDPMGTLWVAKNGVFSGAWRRATDVLHLIAYMAGNAIIPGGAGETMPYDTIVTDLYGMFNTSSHIFTFPVTGIYRISGVATGYVNSDVIVFLQLNIAGVWLPAARSSTPINPENVLLQMTASFNAQAGQTGYFFISTSVQPPGNMTGLGTRQYSDLSLDYLGTGS